jgi:hypothetical protein
MAQENHWLPGFNFNVEEWDAKGQTYGDAGDPPLARTGPRRIQGRGRREASRSVHDQEQATDGEAASGGRLVACPGLMDQASAI